MCKGNYHYMKHFGDIQAKIFDRMEIIQPDTSTYRLDQ